MKYDSAAKTVSTSHLFLFVYGNVKPLRECTSKLSDYATYNGLHEELKSKRLFSTVEDKLN